MSKNKERIKPFAYPCMLILVVFDMLVKFEISGTLNIKGRSIIENHKQDFIQVLQEGAILFG